MFYGDMNKKRSFKLQSIDNRLSEFLMFVFLGHGDSVFGGTDSGSGHWVLEHSQTSRPPGAHAGRLRTQMVMKAKIMRLT